MLPKLKLQLLKILPFIVATTIHSQIISPLEKNNYSKITSYDELSSFVKQLDERFDLLNVDTIGHSVQNRNIFVMKFSNSDFGKDKSKIKVLFFAQQHGNEQSGKEGILLLAIELLRPENKRFFDKIDLALIPQMNPDGSELNQRRNANDIDLNRNHLMVTEPEVLALHRFFDKYQFEFNMDIHEYSPYGDDWLKYGYRKNADITLGANTNPNISEKIRNLSDNEIVPYFLNYCKDKGYTSFIYCPGGPPNIEYFRHSTFDINDGRQSFGIENTFSFIQEGKNGTDSYIDNLKHRSESQNTGMLAMLEYIYNHVENLKRIINEERKNLVSKGYPEIVSIQDEHVGNGTILKIPLFSYFSKTDSIISVNDYRPVVKSIFNVRKPSGYLIPTQWASIIDWVNRQGLQFSKYTRKKSDKIFFYTLDQVESIDFEGDIIKDPILFENEYRSKINPENYIFVPTSQLKGNLIVIALEPKSMLGLVTYKDYEGLIQKGEIYPVLRVLRN